MNHEGGDEPNDNLFNGMQIRAEEIGFAAREMIACGGCGRSSAPNRAACMYCALPLDNPAGATATGRLNFRGLEVWENGWNVVVLPKENVTAEKANELVQLFSIENESFARLLEKRITLPAVRVGSEEDARLAASKLEAAGVAHRLISDESLNAKTPPVRIRECEFAGSELVITPFNSGPTVRIDRDDLVLIVVGKLLEFRFETTATRKKKQNLIADEIQSSADETVIDIYSKDSAAGWRIREKGFTFSCLGPERSLIAGQNMQMLATRLREFSPHAKFVDDYSSIRKALNEVWELEESRESLGVHRSITGRVDISSLNTSNNVNQFTKYSRMQRHLL